LSFWLYIHIASQDASINDVGRLVLPPVYLLHQFTIGLLRTPEGCTATIGMASWVLAFTVIAVAHISGYFDQLFTGDYLG
jgi:hypothetical protein